MGKPPEHRVYLTPEQARGLAKELVDMANEEEKYGESRFLLLKPPGDWKPGDDPLVRIIVSSDCY